MKEAETHDIDLGGDHGVVTRVYQPYGGRYVCDIEVESHEMIVTFHNVHCDVAETLMEQLAKVHEAMLRREFDAD